MINTTFLKDLEACQRYGVARSTWWRWLSEGRIPKPVRIGPRAVRWRMDDLLAWEDSNAASGY